MARVVAVENVGDVLWLCHGTSLIRCAPSQVRPLVEKTGTLVVADSAAAMRDIEEFRARSTQYRDEMKRAGIVPGQRELEDDELNAEYNPEDDLGGDYSPERSDDDLAEAEMLGVVRALIPQIARSHIETAERERTPRRRSSSFAPTDVPEILEEVLPEVPTSAKREGGATSSEPPANLVNQASQHMSFQFQKLVRLSS